MSKVPEEQKSPFPRKEKAEAEQKKELYLFDTFQEWFNNRVRLNGRSYGLGNYAFMDEDGLIADLFNGACFSHCDKYDLYNVKDGRSLSKRLKYFAAHVKPVAHKESSLAMAKWMANDSHWASLILTKDPKYMLDTGTIWDTDASPYFIYNGANILRDIYEHPSYHINWYDLVNAGVDPHAAVVFGMAMSHRKGDKFAMQTQYGGHTFINAASFGPAEFTAYMQNRHVNPDGKMKDGNRDWSSRSYLWGWANSGFNRKTTTNYNTRAKGSRLIYSGNMGQRKNAWGEPIAVEAFDMKDIKELSDIWIKENTVA